PPDIYPLSLHDALPIWYRPRRSRRCWWRRWRTGRRRPETHNAGRGCWWWRGGPTRTRCATDSATTRPGTAPPPCAAWPMKPRRRSEEHTSELQSLAYLV